MEEIFGQSKFILDNALNCFVMHLPDYQSIQLIYLRESLRIIAAMHSNARIAA